MMALNRSPGWILNEFLEIDGFVLAIFEAEENNVDHDHWSGLPEN